MWVAADADEFKEVERKAKFYAARGVETEILDEKQLRRHEPNLREGLAGGLRVPGDSVVYQPRAAAAFLDESIAAGAKLIGESGVAAVESGAVVLKDGTNISCGAIIVAAGAATVGLLPGFEIVSKKGHLVITERYPGFIRHQIIELGYLKSAHSAGSDSVAFNVQPRLTEQVLIGSSRQPGDVTVGVDHAIVERMLRRAFEYMPRLRKLTAVRTWTGFRPATADNLPLIGRHPEMSNVFVAAGHEGLGITTSTGTAAIIADLIAGRASQIDAAPFDPARLYKR
jgi:glycine/D-amino acid oxidase-like deaminating enzyme